MKPTGLIVSVHSKQNPFQLCKNSRKNFQYIEIKRIFFL